MCCQFQCCKRNLLREYKQRLCSWLCFVNRSRNWNRSTELVIKHIINRVVTHGCPVCNRHPPPRKKFIAGFLSLGFCGKPQTVRCPSFFALIYDADFSLPRVHGCRVYVFYKKSRAKRGNVFVCESQRLCFFQNLLATNLRRPFLF